VELAQFLREAPEDPDQRLRFLAERSLIRNIAIAFLPLREPK
jgi:hypothetical protein